MLLWGRPSLMSPLPAPDPANQQWPNLVWKHATMGDQTGPLISGSLPSAHRAGQRENSTHKHTWIWHKNFSSPNTLPILNPPSFHLHTQTQTPGLGPSLLPAWTRLRPQNPFPYLRQVFWETGNGRYSHTLWTFAPWKSLGKDYHQATNLETKNNMSLICSPI